MRPKWTTDRDRLEFTHSFHGNFSTTRLDLLIIRSSKNGEIALHRGYANRQCERRPHRKQNLSALTEELTDNHIRAVFRKYPRHGLTATPVSTRFWTVPSEVYGNLASPTLYFVPRVREFIRMERVSNNLNFTGRSIEQARKFITICIKK